MAGANLKRSFIHIPVFIVFPVILLILVSPMGCNKSSENQSSIANNQPSVSGLAAPPTSPILADFVTINQDSNGQVLSTNLVEFVGHTFDPSAKISINGIAAVVKKDGNYGVVIDLVPGENTLATQTVSQGVTQTQTVTVTFIPPLTVYLNSPSFDNNSNIDYSQTPLNITGNVSNPRATVTLRDVPLTVASDGTFSVQLILDAHELPTVTASLGNENDSDFLPLFLEGTKIAIAPGVSLRKVSGVDYPAEITIKPGETRSQTLTVLIRKDFPPGTTCEFKIEKAVPEEMSPGLKIVIDPSKFNIYQNVTYSIPTIILAADKLTAGTYHFTLNTLIRGLNFISAPLNVNVEP